MTYLDSDYREIITKAVCGRGREVCKSTDYIKPAHRPSSILGCWVINHIYHAKKKSDDCVEVHGKYDVNIWYSFNDNTKTEVVSETVHYRDEVKLKHLDDNCLHDDYEIGVKVVQQPNCLQCKIEEQGNRIAVEVEREFDVKVIGETKVNVKVSPTRHDDRKRRFGEDDARDERHKGKRR